MRPYVLSEEAWMIPVYYGTYGVQVGKVFERSVPAAAIAAGTRTEPVATLELSDAREALRRHLGGLTVPCGVSKAGVLVLDPEVMPRLDGFAGPLPVETVLVAGREGFVERELGSRGTGRLSLSSDDSEPNPCSEMARVFRRVSRSTYTVFCDALGVVSARPVGPRLHRPDPNSPVAVEAPSPDLARAVSRVVARLGGLSSMLDASREVVVKPNLHYHEVYPSVTRPEALAAILTLLLAAGYRVTVAEASGQDTLDCARGAGLLEVCDSLEVPFIAAEAGKCVSLETDIEEIPYVDVFRVFYDARNLVCLGLLKTHQAAGLTAASKHLFGAVTSAARFRAHRMASAGDYRPLHRLIAFLNRVIRPRLTIIDAEQIMLGQGPGFFTGQARVVRESLLLAGRETLALDRWILDHLERRYPGWNPSPNPAVDYLTYFAGDAEGRPGPGVGQSDAAARAGPGRPRSSATRWSSPAIFRPWPRRLAALGRGWPGPHRDGRGFPGTQGGSAGLHPA